MIRDTDNTIIKIKVSLSQTNTFPFDLIYIVQETHKALIPQMFPYCLCLPFNADLVKRVGILCANVQRTITITQQAKEDHRYYTGMKTVVHELLESKQLQHCFLVVPVLPRTHAKVRNQRRKDRNPAYLVANKHRNGTVETPRGKVTRKPVKALEDFFSFFNDFTVMFTPRGPIRPICRACPRHLEHVQGKCSLGNEVCYASLIVQPAEGDAYEQL